MSEWREVRLGEICLETYSGGTPSTTVEEYWNGGILWLSSGETNQKYIYNTEKRITELGVKKSSTKLAPKHSIVIASAGQGKTRGQVSYIMKDMYINQSVICLRPNEKVLLPLFLYYNLDCRYEEIRLLSDSNSSRGSITTNFIDKLKIKIPDLTTQEKIADVLSTYDELIENNNRRIEILEKTAEEIYKEWFVRMRFPGYQNATFVKGIPEGWEVKKVEDIISFDIGGGWGIDTIEDDFTEKAYVIRGTDISDMRYGNFNYEILRFHKKSNLKNRRLKDKDIIFEVSGGSADQRLGRTIYVTDEILSMYDEDVICASFCKLIRIDDKYLSWFFNHYLSYSHKTEALSTFEVQSTGISNFGFTNFKKHHSILVPEENLLKKFYYLTYDMYANVNKLWKTNQNLIKQRDLLLPRLINGTIEVK